MERRGHLQKICNQAIWTLASKETVVDCTSFEAKEMETALHSVPWRKLTCPIDILGQESFG